MAQYDFDAPELADELALEPRRTSVLAILSLVCGLVCVVPGMGVLASIFGIAGLIGINKSRGRVGGTGLAATGLILGLLFSMVWLAILYGATKVASVLATAVVRPANEAFVAMDNGDYSKVRGLFLPRAQERMKDEDLVKFHEAIFAQYGKFKRVPDSPFEAWQHLMSVGSALSDFQGRQDIIPLPVEFEKGWALVIVQIEQGHAGRKSPPGTSTEVVPIINMYVSAPGNKRIDLYPPAAVPALLPPDAVGLPPPPAPKPGNETPDPPKPEEKK